MGIYQNSRGRVSNHVKARLNLLNNRFPVGAQCRYTNMNGREEIVTVASPFCIIDMRLMALFKEKSGWVEARVRELPAPPLWAPSERGYS